MSKTTAPLLSFRADGSVGKKLTYAHTLQGTVAKRCPTHPDARTLTQLYQRWRFVDARYYWQSLSDAQRAAYAAASPSRTISGWAYFLSIYLKNPPDQILWLRLDEIGGATAHDFSVKGNDGTIFGAVPAEGIIDGAYLFDNLDDYINCGHDASLGSERSAQTWGFWFNASNLLYAPTYYALKEDGAAYPRILFYHDNLHTTINLAVGLIDLTLDFTDAGRWYHYMSTYDQVDHTVRLYLNGLLEKSLDVGGSGNIKALVGDLLIGGGKGISPFDGLIDDFRIYNRALTAEHIYEIATTQRYPEP